MTRAQSKPKAAKPAAPPWVADEGKRPEIEIGYTGRVPLLSKPTVILKKLEEIGRDVSIILRAVFLMAAAVIGLAVAIGHHVAW